MLAILTGADRKRVDTRITRVLLRRVARQVAGSATRYPASLTRCDEAVMTLLGFRPVAVMGVIAIAATSLPSAERLPVRTFTTADGLPRDQLQCVRSDRRGFIWFCTAEGLVRFDGQAAVTFGRDHGLRAPGVRSFLNASSDRYFVGVDDGLYTFDAGVVTGPARFRSIERDDRQRMHGVNALAESRDGTIWCATGGGLLHFSQPGGVTHLVEVDIGLPRAPHQVI